MKNLTIYIDAGHSGINDKGEYLTAPSKMFEHKEGEFHNGSTFYEGVSNRVFAKQLEDMLKTHSFDVVRCYHTVNDISLRERVMIANKGHRERRNKNGRDNEFGLYISLHSDASDGTARGLGCWTAENAKTSEFVAGIMSNYFSNRLGNKVKIRPNKQKNFYVVKNTTMPAVLIENLFFDNYDDATILMNKEYQNAFISALVAAIEEYSTTLGIIRQKAI